MIIDSHCHAWERWPYQPAVPDPHSRARAERLLWEMDQAGVEQAVLISATIGGNDDNAAYTNSCAQGSVGRLIAFPDVDCRWHAMAAGHSFNHNCSVKMKSGIRGFIRRSPDRQVACTGRVRHSSWRTAPGACRSSAVPSRSRTKSAMPACGGNSPCSKCRAKNRSS